MELLALAALSIEVRSDCLDGPVASAADTCPHSGLWVIRIIVGDIISRDCESRSFWDLSELPRVASRWVAVVLKANRLTWRQIEASSLEPINTSVIKPSQI